MDVEVDGRCTGLMAPDFQGNWENPGWLNDARPLPVINVCSGVDAAGMLEQMREIYVCYV
jgi:hypothetical protein